MTMKEKGQVYSRSERVIWKIKRSFGNIGHKFHLVRLPKMGGTRTSWITILILIAISFSAIILAGGIYDLLEKPVSLLPKSNGQGWSFIYSGGMGEQTLNESILSAILYMTGVGGLYMLFNSTRHVYRPRNAYILLFLGFIITLIIMYYTGQLIAQKGG